MWLKGVILVLCVYESCSEMNKLLVKKNCEYSYAPTCLKLEIVSWLENINEEKSYDVLPGVTLVRQEGSDKPSTVDILQDLARDFPDDPEARLDAFLIKKAAAYVTSHTIKLDGFEGSTDGNETSRQLGGGGGKGGGGGGGGGGKGGGGGGGVQYLLAAAAMLKGTLYAIALKGIALVAGKALMTGLLALVLSGIIGLKSLTQQGEKHSTYEVIAKPIHYEEHAGHSGYRRSYEHAVGNGLPLGLQPGYSPS